MALGEGVGTARDRAEMPAEQLRQAYAAHARDIVRAAEVRHARERRLVRRRMRQMRLLRLALELDAMSG